MSMTPELYLSGCKRRFGTSNPERMVAPVWEWMMHRGHHPYQARKELGIERDFEPSRPPKNPDWCFQRMGMALVEMPDGRRISIGGEYDDWYDPDFCIYNDVIVQRGGEIEIYGYPLDVFPPTDFHTATLVGNDIWLIGALGYGDAHARAAQVYVLDSTTYEIRKPILAGKAPPRINHHRAILQPDERIILVSKGDVMGKRDGEFWRGKNMSIFELDTGMLTWKEVTDTSSWQQYRIEYKAACATPEDYMEMFKWNVGKVLRELGYTVQSASCQGKENAENEVHSLSVSDVPARIERFYGEIVMVTEGDVSENKLEELFKGLMASMKTSKMHVTDVVRAL